MQPVLLKGHKLHTTTVKRDISNKNKLPTRKTVNTLPKKRNFTDLED